MEHWLDDLARGSARGLARRSVVRRLGVGLVAALLGSVGLGAQTEAAPDPPGGTCQGGLVPTWSGCCLPANVCKDPSDGITTCCSSASQCCKGSCCPANTTCQANGDCVCNRGVNAGGLYCSGKCCAQQQECCAKGNHSGCTSVLTDSSNCGACGVKCFGPTPNCCDGGCMNITKDKNNCGGCAQNNPNHKCGPKETCLKGKCVSTEGCGSPDQPDTLFTCKGSIPGNAICCGQAHSCCQDSGGGAACCVFGCCSNTPSGCCSRT